MFALTNLSTTPAGLRQADYAAALSICTGVWYYPAGLAAASDTALWYADVCATNGANVLAST